MYAGSPLFRLHGDKGVRQVSYLIVSAFSFQIGFSSAKFTVAKYISIVYKSSDFNGASSCCYRRYLFSSSICSVTRDFRKENMYKAFAQCLCVVSALDVFLCFYEFTSTGYVRTERPAWGLTNRHVNIVFSVKRLPVYRFSELPLK